MVTELWSLGWFSPFPSPLSSVSWKILQQTRVHSINQESNKDVWGSWGSNQAPEDRNREADKSWLAEAGKPGWQGSLGGWGKQETHSTLPVRLQEGKRARWGSGSAQTAAVPRGDGAPSSSVDNPSVPVEDLAGGRCEELVLTPLTGSWAWSWCDAWDYYISKTS